MRFFVKEAISTGYAAGALNERIKVLQDMESKFGNKSPVYKSMTHRTAKQMGFISSNLGGTISAEALKGYLGEAGKHLTGKDKLFATGKKAPNLGAATKSMGEFNRVLKTYPQLAGTGLALSSKQSRFAQAVPKKMSLLSKALIGGGAVLGGGYLLHRLTRPQEREWVQ